jgi:glutathione synthase
MTKKPFRFLWITDPWETLDHAKDTTVRLMQESLELGVPSFWCDVQSIRFESPSVLLDAYEVLEIGKTREKTSIRLGPAEAAAPNHFSSLQYRTDPPVDLAYQHPLQILRLGLDPETELVNPWSALLCANEKLEAAFLQEFFPPTCVSSQWTALEAFGAKEGRTVLKPLHLAQSIGIELLDWKSDRSGARKKIEAATDGFKRPVLLQRYLAGIAQGETRLWFLDGKLLASAKKLPLENDFRVNIDRGSRLAAHRPTLAEMKASAEIGQRLRGLGVRLAAVDLIENFITDFNLTSPGLITQMEEVTGKNLARFVIKALTKRFTPPAE